MWLEYIDDKGARRIVKDVAEFRVLVLHGVIKKQTFIKKISNINWTTADNIEEFNWIIAGMQAANVRFDDTINDNNKDKKIVNINEFMERIKKVKALFLGCLLGLSLAILAPIWSIFSLINLDRLVGSHGWGRVPQAAIDAAIEPDWLQSLAISGLVIAAICLAALFYQPAAALRAIGVADSKWSPGWTAGALFIPLLNFYRPWVGLNEAERTMLGVLERPYGRRLWPVVAQRGLGLPTTLYAVFFCISVLFNKVLDLMEQKIISRKVESLAQFQIYATEAEIIMIVSASSILFMATCHLTYWMRMIRIMREFAHDIQHSM